MDSATIVQIIMFLAMELGVPLVFVALLHYKLGKYPQTLPLEENKQKGSMETLIMWALLTLIFIVIIFSGFIGPTTIITPSIALQLILITLPFYVIIPVLYLRQVKKWTLIDFGFSRPLPNSFAPILFSVIIFTIAGALPLSNSNFTPVPVYMILFALIQPAFYEEFFFRGIIQGNLERVLGQNKAWIYGGILFGLTHVIPNYFVSGFDLFSGFIKFLSQTIAGWMYGILYMKTRSLWPGMFAHFLTNGTLASIIATIF